MLGNAARSKCVNKTSLFIIPNKANILFINKFLSTALPKHHANGDTSMVTEIVNLSPIV